MSDIPNATGSVLAGRYRLEDLLAEAPGAKFWRATDEILARNVAVHVIAAADPRSGELLDAARTSATVTDPHFLRVLDAAEEGGVVYVVNEWGSGMSLDQMLSDGPLPPRRAAWVVKEVAEAIASAHRNDIAHGRLLPENVMVSEAGSVKLIGFVVDSVLHNGHPTDTTTNDDEQARDVIDLGALLYVALVGRWPGSPGSELPEAPRGHGHSLRPRQVRAGVPRPLDTICDRVLNADAHPEAMRVATAFEICAALSDYLGSPTGPAHVDIEPTRFLASPEGGPTDQTQAVALPEQQPAAAPDPEETQAGSPVFFDQDSGTAWWTNIESRGLGSSDEVRPGPPPPPVLPELEPRPLFAPDPPGGPVRRPQPDPRPDAWSEPAGSSMSPPPAYPTSGGTGSLPAVWGPDSPGEEPTEWDGAESGKRWLKLAGIVALCVFIVVGILVALNLNRDSATSPDRPREETTTATPATREILEVVDVSDFDPQGDPSDENPDQVPLATDGDPATAWGTLIYQGNPKLGLLKTGVGLLVDLGSSVEVSEVRLTLIGEPTSLQILAAQDGAGAPTTDEGLPVVASATGAGTDVDLELAEPVTTQYLVVWLTSLPSYSGGYKGQVAEIVVRG